MYLDEARERENRLKRIALDLFERCESEELTVGEYLEVLGFMRAALHYRVKLKKC